MVALPSILVSEKAVTSGFSTNSTASVHLERNPFRFQVATVSYELIQFLLPLFGLIVVDALRGFLTDFLVDIDGTVSADDGCTDGNKAAVNELVS